MSVKKENKKETKPEVKKEDDFNEEDDNKSLILLAVGIILVIGLMIGVITYLNKSNDKTNKVDNNKQNEVIKEKEDESEVVKKEEAKQEESATVVQTTSAPVEKTKYTVNFYNGQRVVKSLSVESGNNISSYNLSLGEKQRFKYWYYFENGIEKIFDFNSDTVNSNLNLYAKIVNLFEVKFMFRDAEIIESQIVESGSLLEELNEEDLVVVLPTGGYEKVSGWYKDPNYGQEFDLNTPITEDLELNAKYETAYKVEFYLEESDDFSSYSGTKIEKYVIENEKVEKVEEADSDDKVLKEWHEISLDSNLNPPYTTTLYDFDTLVDKSFVLVPIFGYELIYNTNGGNEIKSIVLEENESLVEPNTPTKPGYKFNKWVYNDEADVDFANDVITEHTTINAVWDAAVTFETYGGTELSPAIPDNEGKLPVIPDPQKDGYTFIGWYYDEEFNLPADVVNETFEVPEVLYAKYEANENTITYNLNGGVNTLNNGVNETQKANTDSSVTLKDLTNTYTKDNHVLLGYSTAPNGEIEYKLGEEIKMPTSDLDLYAVWGELHTLTVHFNGGTLENSNLTFKTVDVIEGDTIIDEIEEISSSVSAPDDMELSGYNTESNGQGTNIDEQTKMPNTDYSVHIIWKSIE